MSPHRVFFPAPPAQDFAGDSLADLGEHLITQADYVPVINADLHRRQHLAHGVAERAGGIDRDHLQLLQPRLGTLLQPAGDVRAGAAIDDAEDVAGVGVDEGRHPRFDPAPLSSLGVLEPLSAGEAVLINPECSYRHHVRGRDGEGIGSDGGVDRCPPKLVAGAGSPDRHPLIQHCFDGGCLQPGGAPGTERKLVGDLGEGPPKHRRPRRRGTGV